MQEHVIFLGGFELAYMQKLALYFNSRLNHDTRVEIMNVLSEPLTPEGNTVWIGSEHFIGEVRQRREEASCVVLAEDVSEDASHVFRYQPCEKLYQKVMFRYRQMQGFPVVSVDDIRQTWFVITTDAALPSLLAFSVTFAQILGERGGVLYLNLSECSGMEDVFLLERGMDLTDAAVELRKDGEVCLDACIRRLEQMDYIMPPVNPMILHELREREVQRLIRAVKQKREYAYVVVALGSSCCGCEFFFRTAARIIHLAGQGYLSSCGRKDWVRFIRLCLGEKKTPVEQISVPQIFADQGGIHLIRAWQEDALGQAVRACLDREVEE